MPRCTATVRFTDDDRNALVSRVSRYIGRHMHSLPPPCGDAIIKLVEARVPRDDLAIWRAVRHRWLLERSRIPIDPNNIAWGRPSVVTHEYNVGIPISLSGGHQLLVQVQEAHLNELALPWWYHPDVNTPVYPVNVGRVLDSDSASFEEWALHVGAAVERCAQSYMILESVIHMASTGGQLHRMCPELVKYVPYGISTIQEQRRRSPLPHGWMSVDRYALKDALDHLALCHLLPDSDPKVDSRFQKFMHHNTTAVGSCARSFTTYGVKHVVLHTPLSEYKSGTWVVT